MNIFVKTTHKKVDPEQITEEKILYIRQQQEHLSTMETLLSTTRSQLMAIGGKGSNTNSSNSNHITNKQTPTDDSHRATVSSKNFR